MKFYIRTQDRKKLYVVDDTYNFTINKLLNCSECDTKNIYSLLADNIINKFYLGSFNSEKDVIKELDNIQYKILLMRKFELSGNDPCSLTKDQLYEVYRTYIVDEYNMENRR